MNQDTTYQAKMRTWVRSEEYLEGQKKDTH